MVEEFGISGSERGTKKVSENNRMPVLVNLNTNDRITLSGVSTTIGRDPDNHIVLPDDGFCSANHARIFWDSGRWLIEDLNSTNGTYVNQEMIQGARPLAPQDEIKFGHSTFRIE